MTEFSDRQPLDQGSEREARVRLAVLAVTVIVVGTYATIASGLAVNLRSFGSHLLESGTVAPALAVIGLAVVVICAAFILAKRWKGLAQKTSPESRADCRGQSGREQFLATLAGTIAAPGQADTRPALHLIDLDRFHRLNLILGDEAGNVLLCGVAERLLAIVEDPALLARIGDDEFALIQCQAGGARHAEIFARRIRNAVEDACAEVPAHARPGVSVGAALCPPSGADARKLLQSASAALHAVKRDGGGQFRLYSADMEQAARHRTELEQAIRDGLQQDWFELVFQPQYDLQTRRLVGFEALVRMNHPVRGEVLPEEFLPVAEDAGLLQPLGAWIISKAIATAADWPVHLNLSINVSASQFRDGDVASTIVQALAESCFEGTRLVVEISEGLLWQASDPVRRQLRRLKRRGVTFVLDDFGVDSSELQSLVRSTCDAIKLDRSFVQRLGNEPEADAIVRGLIGTAQAYDLPVLAEGVERAEQAHFLMNNTCNKVQGFLFSRPAPARDVGAIIARDMRNVATPSVSAETRQLSAYSRASKAASRMSR